MKFSKTAKSLRPRFSIYRTSGPEYFGRGPTASEAIINTLRPIPVTNFLSAVFYIAKSEDLDFYGKHVDQDGRVTFTNHALEALTSIKLSDHGGRAIDYKSDLSIVSARRALTEACLIFNEDGNWPLESDDEVQRVTAVLSPVYQLQDKATLVLKHLTARSAAWYRFLPEKSPALRWPQELDAFLSSDYGVTTRDLPLAALFSWILSDIKTPLISGHSFDQISDWESSKLRRFLTTFSRTVQQFGSPWALESKASRSLHHKLPRILERPLIQLREFDGHPVFAAPMPRLVLNHLEDFVYWKGLNFFKSLDGRIDNRFSNCFGRIFGEYCWELIRAVGDPKATRDLRFLESTNHGGPDAAEILASSTTFFEFKGRRLQRDATIVWNEHSETQMKEAARPIVDQLVRFVKRITSDKSHPLRAAIRDWKNWSFIVITPAQFPINQYLRLRGWFQTEIAEMQAALGTQRAPRIYFGCIKDLETLQRTGNRHVFIGPTWNQFARSEQYPYEYFWAWFARNRWSTSGFANPYLDEVINRAYNELRPEINFKKNAKN